MLLIIVIYLYLSSFILLQIENLTSESSHAREEWENGKNAAAKCQNITLWNKIIIRQLQKAPGPWKSEIEKMMYPTWSREMADCNEEDSCAHSFCTVTDIQRSGVHLIGYHRLPWPIKHKSGCGNDTFIEKFWTTTEAVAAILQIQAHLHTMKPGVITNAPITLILLTTRLLKKERKRPLYLALLYVLITSCTLQTLWSLGVSIAL